MKTKAQNLQEQKNQQVDLFEQFSNNQLDHSEMFAVRGGDNDGGSHADVQEDGFN
jgi:hypothetical protein